MEKQLKQAIIEQLGYEDLNEECKQTLADVCRGGGNSGWSGFTYSNELLEFYNTNKKLILDYHKELASELGEGFLEMIKGFNCLKDSGLEVDEIAEIIYSNKHDHECATMLIDALCWSVLEGLAFELDN